MAAACGGSDEGATPNLPGTADGTEGTAAMPADDRECDPNGLFRYVFVQNPANLDPHRSANPWDMVFLRLVYDQLLREGEDGELEPMLATSWEFSDDERTLELTLRDDVTFQDGEPFNAEAVVANLERAKTLEGSTLAGPLEAIESVEAVEEHLVRINLSGPGGNLPYLFTDRYGTMISPAAMDNPDLDLNPVGSGMMRLTEYVPDQVSRYERNEDYWDPEAAKLANIEIYVQKSSPTRLNMLRTGQAELTYLLPPDMAAAEAAVNVAPSKSKSIMSFYMNPGDPPLDDYRVRAALEHAINKEALVQGVFLGAGQPVAQFLPPDHWAYHPDITPENPDYAYDPDRARELLAEAGYPDGFEFEFLIPALDDHRAIGEAIVPMLAEVGITANPRVIESATTPVTFYGNLEGNAFPGMGSPFPDPTVPYLTNLPGQYANPWNVTSQEFIDAFQAALGGTTPEERTPDVHRMIETEKAIRKNIPMFLATPPSAWTDNVVFPEGYTPAYAPHFRGVCVTSS